MEIFIIYLASNQGSHFQKISQMNVLNAINIGLTVKPIHRNHVFGMTVFYQFQIAEFTLYRFLRSQQIGNLHIRHTIRFLGNKINLSLIHLTNIYFIPHPAQMDIYSVLHHLFYIKTPVATYNMIPDSQVFEIELVA